jgi:hypothetical protein
MYLHMGSVRFRSLVQRRKFERVRRIEEFFFLNFRKREMSVWENSLICSDNAY